MQKRLVLKKQQNSRMCFVCGMKNDIGLKARFYELEHGEIVAVFTPIEQHQSYPGRMHGGIAATILDETMGRAMMVRDPDSFGVTVSLKLDYKKPVPLGQPLKVTGRITKDTSRLFECTGELLLENGDVAVIGFGKYLKMPMSKITENLEDEHALDWRVIEHPEDPEFVVV
jgi:acyl-coenzyme A thioesterase PaaI-like protein